jgi:cell division protein FtsI (penicillin-binding protein 3)
MISKGHKIRIIILGAFLSAAALALVFSAWRLQISEHDYYARRAERQQRARLRFYPLRGSIYDVKGEQLAVNITLETIYAMAREIPDHWEAAVALAPVLGKTPDEIYRRLGKVKNFTYLARKVEPAIASRIRQLDLKGVHLSAEDARFYPNLHLAAQLLGFVGTDHEGLEGVENYYDEILSAGRDLDPESIVMAKDGLGRPIAADGAVPAVPSGNSLVLTIDRNIQYFAEKELTAAAVKFKAKSGSVVVVDPKTGDLLAIANWPVFNPNRFLAYSPTAWKNRAVTYPLEPGSTVKPLTIAAALDRNLFSATDIIFCENGNYQIGSFQIKDDKKSHGWLTVSQILAQSSNIGVAKISLTTGKRVLHDYFAAFGFGAKTGIGLPAENAGIMRTVRRWSELDTATAGFGQGISVTALQLAGAYSALANGGLLPQLRVIKRIIDEDRNIVEEKAPKMIRRVIKSGTADLVTDMLIAATGEKGTGRNANVSGYTVAGKTGTAQMADEHGYLDDSYMASFAGYVPAKNPRLVIVVQLVEPRGSIYGGTVAAPVFSNIARQSLAYLGVPFEGDEGNDRRQLFDNAVNAVATGNSAMVESLSIETLGDSPFFVIPSFNGMGMRSVARAFEGRNVDLRLNGSGIACAQDPSAGSEVSAGHTISVRFCSVDGS